MRATAFLALVATIPGSLCALAPRATNAGPCGVCPYSSLTGVPDYPPTITGNTLVCEYAKYECQYDLSSGKLTSGDASHCFMSAKVTPYLCPQAPPGTTLTEADTVSIFLKCVYSGDQCEYSLAGGGLSSGTNCPQTADTCTSAGTRRRSLARDSRVMQRQAKMTRATHTSSPAA